MSSSRLHWSTLNRVPNRRRLGSFVLCDAVGIVDRPDDGFAQRNVVPRQHLASRGISAFISSPRHLKSFPNLTSCRAPMFSTGLPDARGTACKLQPGCTAMRSAWAGTSLHRPEISFPIVSRIAFIFPFYINREWGVRAPRCGFAFFN